MPKIKISGGYIKYKVHPLYLGVKRIEKKQANENLQILKKVLDTNKVTFGLIAGTLLGAVREQDFISHDEDIDLFLYEEDESRVLNMLPMIIATGYEVARYDKRGLLSLIRKGEYIDLYFFKKDVDERYRNCCGWIIPKTFLENLTSLSFKNNEFYVPREYENYLIYEYGTDWRIPIPWTDFKVSSFKRILFEIKEIIKYSLPPRIFNLLSKKAEFSMREKYKFNVERYNKLFSNEI